MGGLGQKRTLTNALFWDMEAPPELGTIHRYGDYQTDAETHEPAYYK